jgi:glycosyltransferase involved in cell wall biosynthesis
MRVCYISTYPPTECGIATYTEYLSQAVKKHDKEIHIVSQLGAKGHNVYPIYSPIDNDIATKLFHVSSKITPDVINIQHEYGLFGSESGIQILDFLYRCKIANLPTVTTIHTVYEKLERHQEIILESICSSSSAIIVHEPYQKATLKTYFPEGDKKVHVLPHGIRENVLVPNAKKLLGLEGKKILLLAGYFRPTKAFHKIVKLFPKIAEKDPNIVLLVAGKMRGLEYSEYQKYFYDLINTSPAFNQIQVLRGQFPQHTFDTILSAADVMAMPYEAGAQSGIMAQAGAFNLPIVASPNPSFINYMNEVKGGIIAYNDEELTKALVKILTNDSFRNSMKNDIKEFKKPRLWSNIAREHIKVYESIINVPYGKAKYFYLPEDQYT